MRWGVLGLVLLAGCGLFRRGPEKLDAVPGATQTGVASWYGPGFHGRQTANGEIYDQHALTAAHRTLPLGTWVRVTNVAGERAVVVRVNDRGPYVDDRVIDLSLAAAQRIDLVRPGVAPVRIEVLEGPTRQPLLPISAPRPVAPSAPPLPAPPAAGARYAVHAGTFADYQRARFEQQRLAADGARAVLALVEAPEARYYQVRLGPFDDADEAARVARRIAALGLPALVVSDAPTR
jgi:rare lipoprotein A